MQFKLESLIVSETLQDLIRKKVKSVILGKEIKGRCMERKKSGLSPP